MTASMKILKIINYFLLFSFQTDITPFPRVIIVYSIVSSHEPSARISFLSRQQHGHD
jgi:hypothetical protein